MDPRITSELDNIYYHDTVARRHHFYYNLIGSLLIFVKSIPRTKVLIGKITTKQNDEKKERTPNKGNRSENSGNCNTIFYNFFLGGRGGGYHSDNYDMTCVSFSISSLRNTCVN